MKRFREWLCGMWGGHRFVLTRTENRLHLVCVRCRRQTPGWVTSETSPRVVHALPDARWGVRES